MTDNKNSKQLMDSLKDSIKSSVKSYKKNSTKNDTNIITTSSQYVRTEKSEKEKLMEHYKSIIH